MPFKLQEITFLQLFYIKGGMYMSLIDISNLSFSYESSIDPIFEHVSFQIDTNWKLGFTGRNGRGKTTFLNLLLGNYTYTGSIKTSVSFEYFPYHIQNQESLSIDIMREIAPLAFDWQLIKELSLMNVKEDVLYRPFCTLSQGERTKILLAALFLNDNKFLLIDEPTNHLDMDGRKKIAEYLKKKHGFILVSHDRTFLDTCIDHILVINKTNIEIQKGNFSSWQQNKEKEDQFELAENLKLKREIQHLKEAARITELWAQKTEESKFGQQNSGSKVDRGYVGHKAAKMMKRSKSTQRRQLNLLEQKAGLLKNIDLIEKLKIEPLKYHANRLVELKNISIAYETKEVIQDVNFTIEQGDRIALVGKNGSGKSSILKLILGDPIPYTGILQKGKLVISYVPQNADYLKGSLSEFINDSQINESLFKTILCKLDFARTLFDFPIDNYSSGQKKKLLIAASLCHKAHLYIWDEPLNYIDILSRIQIEELIIKFKPTILMVEHDSAFVSHTATKIIDITQKQT